MLSLSQPIDAAARLPLYLNVDAVFGTGNKLLAIIPS
jgi:hypothetical protein